VRSERQEAAARDDVGFTDSCGDYGCAPAEFGSDGTDRLNGGRPVAVASKKRSSLDRLNGDLIGFNGGWCDGGECEPSPAAVKRNSLDRLKGDFIGVVGWCDGGECGPVAAKRNYDGDGTATDDDHVTAAKWRPSWSAISSSSSSSLSSSRTIDRLGGGLVFVRRQPLGPRQQLSAADVYTLLRRFAADRKHDADDGDNCLHCDSPSSSSSSSSF